MTLRYVTLRYVTWRDLTWPDVTWPDPTWRDVMWREVTWRYVTWSDVTWRDVMWCDVMWCDVMWCDVMWCDVMWCDVLWCDVKDPSPTLSPTFLISVPVTGPIVAQRVGRGIALLFHDTGIRRGWVISSTPRSYFTPAKGPVPIVQEAGWAPGPVWAGGKSRPTGIRSPDRPARSQLLYRLSYPAHVYKL